MAIRKRNRGKTGGGGQPRASITFPPELYRTIEDLAKRKKVSIAWVVRPELVVRKRVFALNYRYRLHARALPGCSSERA